MHDRRVHALSTGHTSSKQSIFLVLFGGFSKEKWTMFVVLLFDESGEQQPKLRAASELWTDPESRINIGILPE